MLYFNLNEYWEPSATKDQGDWLVQTLGTSRGSGRTDLTTIIPPALSTSLTIYVVVF